jgi:hypothetical protein
MKRDDRADSIILLSVKIVEDEIRDGFGMIRTETSPPVEIVILHDGTQHGLDKAEVLAALLATTCMMRELLDDAARAWAREFDVPDGGDTQVPGADLVDWFSAWRLKAKTALHLSKVISGSDADTEHPGSDDDER